MVTEQLPLKMVGTVTFLLLGLLLHDGALAQGPKRPHDTQQTQTEYCEEYDLGEGLNINYVTMSESLSFMLKPSDPLLHLRMMVDDTLYKVTVHGTMLEMMECDREETNCTMIDEGGSKGSNIIDTGVWNKVTVTHTLDHQMTVVVNNRATVKSMHMSDLVQLGREESQIEVALVNVDPSLAVSHEPGYQAQVRVVCNDTTDPPMIREEPPLPMPTILPTSHPISPISPAPYPECALMTVEADHPYSMSGSNGTRTLAVFPSSPALYLQVTLPEEIYKVMIDEERMELTRCDGEGEDCDLVEGNNTPTDVLTPGMWNYVEVAVLMRGVHIKVNNDSDLMSQTRVRDASTIFITVLPAPLTGRTDHYTVAVNLKCDVPYSPGQSTIQPPLVSTADAIVESRTTPAPDSSSGTSYNTVGIIVGVLLAVLAILAVAFAVSTYKKRQSANINQHTPLQQQQQAQY